MEIREILNSLIADEISAWWMYWFMHQISKGTSFHAISQELKESADDELNDHATKLIMWSQANNIEVEVMPDTLLNLANCPIEKFSDGIDTAKVLTLVILSERCAIKTYKKYYNLVKDIYPDLGFLFLEISIDEQEHLNKFLDLGNQMRLPKIVLDGTSLSGESNINNLVNRMKKLF